MRNRHKTSTLSGMPSNTFRKTFRLKELKNVKNLVPFLSYDLKLNTGRGETWDSSSWDIYLLSIKAIQGTHCHKEAK